MEFTVPSAPKVYTKTLVNFLGADFTSAVPMEKRSPNMRNVINNNGYIETRPGYAQVGTTITVATVPQKLNGVWNFDIGSTEVFIVYAGTKIYSTTSAFTTYTELLDAVPDTIAQGIYINNKLIILNGTRAIICGIFTSAVEAKYLDTVGYIPTTVIGRNPDGTGGTLYEGINCIQAKRTNLFLSNGTATVYTLDSASLDNVAITVSQLDNTGTWNTIAATEYTFDRSTGTVTFDTAPGVSPVDGRDNISIIFSKTNSSLVSYINKCTIGTLFGYDGNNNRIFVTGNVDFANVDWFSGINDGTYFPVDNYTTIGHQPIINYIRLSDGTLGVQKAVSDTDSTIFYRTSALYNGAEVFPVTEGVNTIGCISKYANSNLLNDQLTLTDQGVYAITSTNNQKFAVQRDYYVNTQLLAEANLQNATSIVYQNRYYLAVNNHVYVADSRYKSTLKDSKTDSWQYEWYYWTNVPIRVWFTYNNELYFGTVDGKIAKFNTTCLDYTTPIDVYYETGYLDCDSILYTKTVKNVTLVTKPTTPLAFEFGYITEDGTQEIVSKQYGTSTFPKILQEKEKIKKFMYIKFYISNNTNVKMSFYQFAITYIYSGKYRGE